MARLAVEVRAEQASFTAIERIWLRLPIPEGTLVWLVWSLQKEDDLNWWRNAWPSSI